MNAILCENVKAEDLNVICSHCKVILKVGKPEALTSHGICQKCKAIWDAEIDKLFAAEGGGL